jgi:4-amino-4-deoxy-L-arabinose transferase-like glycosyltransferase
MYPDFTTLDLSFLISGSTIIIVSAFLFQFEKRKSALFLLVIGTFLIGCFIGFMNDYLSTWDEQIHAVVAKNMIHRPFQPMLYTNPLLNYDYKNWPGNHIWLHKPPLFLWQMALSMGIFGVNIFGLRLPGILLHALLCIFIYRIGKITVNEKTGFYGALFFAIAHYPLEMVSGIYASDHNDVTFLFYVTASFWSWFEYWHTGKRKWLFLIGLFAGCAFLTKWITGLLVFPIWGMILLTNHEMRRKIRSYLDLLLSFTLSVLVFLPWQIYIFNIYPQEAKYEFLMNSRHLTECVEGKCGDIWFYFKNLSIQYGAADIMPYFMLLSFLVYIFKISTKDFKKAVAGIVLIVFLVFSVAQTKMISYTAIVLPFAFLSVAAIIDSVLSFILRFIKVKIAQKIIYVCIALTIAFFLFNIGEIYHNHTYGRFHENWEYAYKNAEKRMIYRVKEKLKEPNYIIFNASYLSCGYASYMFYTDYAAYSFIPTPEQISIIKKRGYKIAILDFGDLPDYIRKDKEITMIKFNCSKVV